MGREIKEEKYFFLALDHGTIFGPMGGIEDPVKLINAVKEEVDGIIVSPGLAKKLGNMEGKLDLIVRADGAVSKLNPSPEKLKIICSPQRAKKLGAVGVICMGYVGAKASETQSLENVAKLSELCENIDLFLIAEMLPLKNNRVADEISLAARIGSELGANLIKTYYTGNVESFKRVTDSCLTDIIIAGGPKMETTRQALETVREALDAGGKGVAFGRNIWQSNEPKKLCKSIRMIIHEDASVDEVLEL